MQALRLRATPSAPRVRISAPTHVADPRAQLIRDVRIGLSESPRALPPMYLYDEAGSRLYDEITRLPEYYPFRTERGILERAAAPILELCRPRVLVEFGSGSAAKTGLLLDEALRQGLLEGYGAVEVSESALRESFDRLSEQYDTIEFEGVLADFNEPVSVPFAGMPRLLLFLGSTIGNLGPEEAIAFLTDVRKEMGPDDAFLVGFDFVKDVAVLEAAYNDRAGVTAAFNLNLLHRLNRELGADFDVDRFRHHAFYDAEASQIEMHLRAITSQRVDLGEADMTIALAQGDGIRTEISRKFTRRGVGGLAAEAGLEIVSWFADDLDHFGLALMRRAEASASPTGDARLEVVP